MPIYEFYSPSTGKIYSFFARSLSFANRVPICPDGKKHKMKKLFSAFSVTGKSQDTENEASAGNLSGDENPFDGLDPQKANAVMQELESSMAGMNDENPDPRQMGSLMRKMCDLTGEKLDGQMEEVVRKLEEGTHPDELEERFGDLSLDDTVSNSSEEDLKNEKKIVRCKPSRDPKLYEFNEYLQ